MSREAEADTWPCSGSVCLSPDRVLRFAAGRCSEAERRPLDVHLDQCSDCQQLIAAALSALSSDRAPASRIAPGLVVADRYRLVRLLGSGGMGRVFEATDRVLQERVALKLLSDELQASRRGVRHFKAEVQLARRIAHPNVCRVFDLGVHDLDGEPRYFLTMELVEGGTLRDCLERGALDPTDVVRLGRELAAGLSAAHAAGVLHRDFKSDNVLLRAGTSPVITDFGLARSLRDEHSSLGRELVGSAGYMAPEQVCGERLTAATDVYALGVVLFEMLTGVLPFRGATPLATALLRLSHAPPVPSRLRPSLAPEWDDLVSRCLARDPRVRLDSASRVREVLERMAPKRRRRPSGPVAVLGVLGVAAGLQLGAASGWSATAVPARGSVGAGGVRLAPDQAPWAGAAAVDVAPSTAMIESAPAARVAGHDLVFAESTFVRVGRAGDGETATAADSHSGVEIAAAQPARATAPVVARPRAERERARRRASVGALDAPSIDALIDPFSE